MIEIETASGFEKVPAYPANESSACVIAKVFYEPTIPAFQALLAADGGEARFRVGGRVVQCWVELGKAPILEVDKVVCVWLTLWEKEERRPRPGA